jgi:hypothetical protein
MAGSAAIVIAWIELFGGIFHIAWTRATTERWSSLIM